MDMHRVRTGVCAGSASSGAFWDPLEEGKRKKEKETAPNRNAKVLLMVLWEVPLLVPWGGAREARPPKNHTPRRPLLLPSCEHSTVLCGSTINGTLRKYH